MPERRTAMKEKQKSAKTTATKKRYQGFTDEEKPR